MVASKDYNKWLQARAPTRTATFRSMATQTTGVLGLFVAAGLPTIRELTRIEFPIIVRGVRGNDILFIETESV